MAVFEFNDTTFIEAVWFVGDGATKDWMAVMFRQDDGPWITRYRFRYYNSADPDDRDDTKNVYELVLTDNSDAHVREMRDGFDRLATIIRESYGPTANEWKTIVHGGIDAFTAWMRNQPFTHTRVQAAEPKGVQ